MLCRKIERSVTNLKKKLTWNKDSAVIVHGTLSSGVDLTVGGKKIPLSENIRGVLVTYRKVRNNRVNSVDCVEHFDKILMKEAS